MGDIGEKGLSGVRVREVGLGDVVGDEGDGKIDQPQIREGKS